MAAVFTNGSGIEQDGYHGENISREGNIVFCSINHRLGRLASLTYLVLVEKRIRIPETWGC